MFNISMILQCLNITMFYSRRNILVRSCVAEEIEALCGEFLLWVGKLTQDNLREDVLVLVLVLPILTLGCWAVFWLLLYRGKGCWIVV